MTKNIRRRRDTVFKEYSEVKSLYRNEDLEVIKVDDVSFAISFFEVSLTTCFIIQKDNTCFGFFICQLDESETNLTLDEFAGIRVSVREVEETSEFVFNDILEVAVEIQMTKEKDKIHSGIFSLINLFS